MKVIATIILLVLQAVFSANAENITTNKPKWSLEFLVVDEKGKPLSGVNVTIYYMKNENPKVQVTTTNWTNFMVHAERVTDKNGECTISDAGAPDMWQCHFTKKGFDKEERFYSGPANFTGFSGPGPAHQRHKETLRSAAWRSAKFGVTIKAVDALGDPVKGATAKVVYTSGDATNYATGLTDSEGTFAVSMKGEWGNINAVLQKAGYYNAVQNLDMLKRLRSPSRVSQVGFDPTLWNPTVTLTLNRRDPIPMFAKRESTMIPKENESVGFDLTVGDWIAPYGKGKNSDVFFSVQRDTINAREYEAELKLSFPNPGDGLIALSNSPETGSPLLMPHSAPANGYQSEHVWIVRFPRQPSESFLGYFIRIRTLLGENGTMKSALYGKIQGDINFFVWGPRPGMSQMRFDYYLNPVPNSRVVEFDPKRNLLTGLKSEEQINNP